MLGPVEGTGRHWEGTEDSVVGIIAVVPVQKSDIKTSYTNKCNFRMSEKHCKGIILGASSKYRKDTRFRLVSQPSYPDEMRGKMHF